MSNPEIPPADCGEYMARLEWRFTVPEPSEPKRRKRSQDSIFYCQCGRRAHVQHSTDWRNRIDVEMRQVTRARECPSCGRRWRTIELNESELQALRLAAYRGQRADDMARGQGADRGA